MQLTNSQKQEIKDIKRLLKKYNIIYSKLDIHAFVHAMTYYRLEIPLPHTSLDYFCDHYGISDIIYNDEVNRLILIIYKLNIVGA